MRKTITITIILFCLFYFSSYAQQTYDLKRIELAIDQYLTYFSNDNPGAVISVIKKGDIIFEKAYGLSNIQEKEVMTTDKSFNLAELSKAFTSLAVLKLVEKNKLNLDDNLVDIFPNFPDYGKNIFIRNLLNHTSGLKSYDENTFNSNKQVFEFLMKQNETNFPSGSKWKPSNSEYALLASIIEEVSKMTYDAFLRKYIFKKLDMNNTFITNDLNSIPNASYGHSKENEVYVVKRNISKVYGQQGLYMNNVDYAKWDRALYSDKLLKCENLNQIFTVSKLNNGENTPYYGLGWVLMEKEGDQYYWHGSSLNGYSNLVFHLPNDQMTILIMANRNDAFDFLRLAIIIAKQFNRELKL